MAQLAGALEIQIFAGIARITADMQKVQRVVGGSMKSVENAVASAKNALGALGVGLSVGALAMMAKNTIASTAALDDMAEATGASVEKLSRLSVVARVHGQDMNTVQDGLVRLTRGMKGTEEETKNATAALAALGIQSKTASGQLRDPGELMQEIAAKLDTFRDGAGKTAIALDLFGKSGAKLLPFLKDLATAGEYGGKVTAQQAAEAEKLENNLRRMTVAAEEARREIMIGFTPALIDFTEKLLDAHKAAGNLATALLLVAAGGKSLPAVEKEIADREASLKNRGFFGNALGVVTRIGSLGTTSTGTDVDDQVALSLLRRQREYLQLQNTRRLVAQGEDPSNWDARDMRLRGPKAQLNYTGAGKSGGGDADSTYRGLLKTLKEKLLVDLNLTEVNKLQLTLDALSAKQLATITPQREAELKDLAAKVDLLKLQKEAMENDAKNEEALTKMRKEGAAVESEAALKRGEALMQGYENARQIEFEAKLLGMTNEAREEAIALRAIETLGIKKTDEAYAALAEKIKSAVAEKTLAEKNKKTADEITEFWKSAAQSMQQSMSGFFFDVMQGNLGDLAGSFKRTIDRMVADVLAAKAATALFGEDFGKGGSGKEIGGWVGKLFGLVGGGGGAGGMSSGAFGAAVSGGISYAVGTDYVPRTGLALVHQGERIIPAAENKGGGEVTFTLIQNFPNGSDRRSADQAAAAAGAAVQRAMARNS